MSIRPVPTLVQVDHSNDCQESFVDLIFNDASREPDSRHESRAKARRRAEALARLYGCEWEEN